MFRRSEYEALVANEAYEKPENRSDRLGLDLFLIPRFNRKNVCAYRDLITGKVYVGIAGTNPKSIKDLTTDVSLAVNNLGHTNRFKEIEKVVQSLLAQNRTTPVTLSGHSMGGSIAAELTHRNQYSHKLLQAHTYNAGSSPLYKFPRGMNIKNYRTANDLVSRWVRAPRIVKGSGHGMSNFL